MNAGFLFWLLMFVALFYGALGVIPDVRAKMPSWPSGILLWVLLALLGWQAFGPILKG